ncbi:hypothetical protein HF888_11475 [Bermanella marisrubri]|uniref:Uncharacterized protein n=1 Tax=Bermanella marisrubri TaxID=207949 RepID=Q1N153_9GAMM|nr:hypothetical protein [Bermanella marisrubri]EAT11998.1 hypothetical protein RED65_11675 [Oceanobacter sp. RED65] [Bermanella marisrubri]QIZ84802.1 hypothetical protein HF888_11475 [Bermanella marisrubri]
MLNSKRLFSLFVLLACVGLNSQAELAELQDAEMAFHVARMSHPEMTAETNTPLYTSNNLARNNQTSAALSGAPALGPLSNTSQPSSSGITMDIDLQLHIDEIRWVDVDGAGINGTQGGITLKGISVGHLDDMNNPQPAPIRGITIDVDGNQGLRMGINQIGDTQGNGIDVNIDSIQF